MKTTDVVVIGGGIAGIGVAAMLSEHARVDVIERESHCGYHTTGRSAAMHIASYGPAAIRKLSVASKSYLLEPPVELNTGSFLSARGEMALARPGEEDLLTAFVADSPGYEIISTADAVDLVPILAPSCLSGAGYIESAQDIDVDRLLQSWIRLLTNRGSCVHTGNTATEIMRTGKLWKVAAGDVSLEAPVIVNAAGAWADRVATMGGQNSVGLTPCRRSAALLPPPKLPANLDSDFLQWPMFAGVQEDWYARPMSGKLMVSPADEDPVEPHDAFADEMRLAEGLDNFEKMVNVEVTHVEHTWGGLRTFSQDREPVVGFAPESVDGSGGFFWLAGQGGYGIQTSPALSALAAKLVLQQTLNESESELAALLNPVRFV